MASPMAPLFSKYCHVWLTELFIRPEFSYSVLDAYDRSTLGILGIFIAVTVTIVLVPSCNQFWIEMKSGRYHLDKASIKVSPDIDYIDKFPLYVTSSRYWQEHLSMQVACSGCNVKLSMNMPVWHNKEGGLVTWASRSVTKEWFSILTLAS